MTNQSLIDDTFDKYVSDQARSALMMAHTLNEVFAAPPPSPIGASNSDYMARQDLLWAALGGVCAAAANISKVFTPTSSSPRGDARKRALWAVTQARCARMRQRYALNGTELVLDRDVRNDFEHFDERIDEYVQDQVVTFSDRNVMPIQFMSTEDNVIARLFDPSTGNLHTFQNKVNLQILITEIEGIHSKAEAFRAAAGTSYMST